MSSINETGAFEPIELNRRDYFDYLWQKNKRIQLKFLLLKCFKIDNSQLILRNMQVQVGRGHRQLPLAVDLPFSS